MSIGWQLLYEGLWKIKSQSTAKPWTAEPYLKNAQGPFRDHFRNMTGDPNDLNWLDAEKIMKRWDDWKDRFEKHYDLTDKQKERLNDLVNGKKTFNAAVDKLPPNVKFSPTLAKSIKFYPSKTKGKGRLKVDGKRHITPREKRILDSLVKGQDKKDPVVKTYLKGIARLHALSKRLCMKEKLLVSLKGNPERAGATDEAQKGTDDYKKVGQIEIYRELLDRYEDRLEDADEAFKFDHLAYQWRDIQKKKSELIGPVKALEAEMKRKATDLLTEEQLKKGSIQTPLTKVQQLDKLTMWGLAIIGSFLIAGLFTRIAAFGGTVLLLSFYAAYAPFPGYPPLPGPEHSLYINKVFIEALVLFALVFLPTGKWFGVDGLLGRLFFGTPKEKTKTA